MSAGAPATDDRCAVVAIDLGGTAMKVALVGARTRHALRRIPTGRERGYEAVLTDVEATVRSVAAEAADAGLEVAGAGIAVPGVVDERPGVAVLSVTFGWHDLALAERFSSRLAMPVIVRHDVRSAARAEAAHGVAAGRASALFVAIGTGIAATTIIDGEVLDGATHRAGEIGQQLVADPSGGADVTLEAVASARGIAERYRALAGGADGDGGVDAAAVVDRAGAGDLAAQRVWRDATTALADVLAAAVMTVDPAVIVLGGGVSRARAALVDPLAAELARRLPWRPPPPVEIGAFGDDAGVVGVAHDAWTTVGGGSGPFVPAGWSTAPPLGARP